MAEHGPGAAPVYNLFGTRGVTFQDNGTPVAYTLGLPANGSTGAGPQTTSGFTTAQLEVPVDRYATFGHAYYDLTDTMRVFVEGSYNHVEGTVLQSRYFGAPISIFNDNPYVPAALRAVMPPVSGTPSTSDPPRRRSPVGPRSARVFSVSEEILARRHRFEGSWGIAGQTLLPYARMTPPQGSTQWLPALARDQPPALGCQHPRPTRSPWATVRSHPPDAALPPRSVASCFGRDQRRPRLVQRCVACR